eukprot:364911-Chlamydomonas_euryale.AAC.3
MQHPCSSHETHVQHPFNAHAAPMQCPCSAHAAPIQRPCLAAAPMPGCTCSAHPARMPGCTCLLNKKEGGAICVFACAGELRESTVYWEETVDQNSLLWVLIHIRPLINEYSRTPPRSWMVGRFIRDRNGKATPPPFSQCATLTVPRVERLFNCPTRGTPL